MTELINVEPVRHATPKRRGLLVTVVALAVAVVALAVGGGTAYKSQADELATVTQERDQARTDMANTQTQLTDARGDVAAWVDVADKWRLCSVAGLEVATGLLDGGLIGGLSPLGSASVTCGVARDAQDTAEGANYA